MAAPERTKSDRLPNSPPGGGDVVVPAFQPDAVERFWVEGDAFPRLVIDPTNGSIKTGPGSSPPSSSPGASDAVINGGMYVPRRSLDRFAVSPISGLKHVCVIGASIDQGTAVTVNVTGGYLDGWVDRVRRALGTAIGPLVGEGFFGLWRAGNQLGQIQSSNEWSFAGAWSLVSAASAADIAIYQQAWNASGATNILTWTRPLPIAQRNKLDVATHANNTTVAVGSNNAHTNTFAGAGVLNVASTAGFPAAGVILLFQSAQVFSIITYTGITGTTFTGCTTLLTNTPSQDVLMATGMVVSNTQVVTAASGFVATDVGQGLYGTAIPYMAHVLALANATNIVLSRPATSAVSGQQFGLLGRRGVTVAQIDIIWMDSPISAGFSYSTNGGGTWVDVPTTLPSGFVIVKTSVTIANPTDFRIRAATAAGVGGLTIQCGIVAYSTVAPTTGVVVHNMAMDGGAWIGSATNFSLIRLAGGDSLRMLDNASDPGNNGSFQPSLCIVHLGVNDLQNLGAALAVSFVQLAITTFQARMGPYCDIILVCSYEVGAFGTGAPNLGTAAQQQMRDGIKAVAAANRCAVLDLYDGYAAQGELGFVGANADGLINYDGLHPSLEAHSDIAGHVMRMLARLAV